MKLGALEWQFAAAQGVIEAPCEVDDKAEARRRKRTCSFQSRSQQINAAASGLVVGDWLIITAVWSWRRIPRVVQVAKSQMGLLRATGA